MRNLVISLPKLIHACIIFGTVSNISRDLRRFLVLATVILPLDDGSTGNGRSWILVAEWWQMVYCQLNPVLWLKQFVTQPDIIPHFHEPKLVGRDFERCSVHCLLNSQLAQRHLISHAAHTVCAHATMASRRSAQLDALAEEALAKDAVSASCCGLALLRSRWIHSKSCEHWLLFMD